MNIQRAAWLMCIFAVGCAGENPLGRHALTGTVTFQGQPLRQGNIEFTPENLNEGVSSGAVIEDGNYSIAREQGLPAGAYRVAIWSAGSTTEPLEDALPGEPTEVAVERLPAKYNLDSQLTIQVAEGDEQRFDFDLK
jgi:hypothetical protein